MLWPDDMTWLAERVGFVLAIYECHRLLENGSFQLRDLSTLFISARLGSQDVVAKKAS